MRSDVAKRLIPVLLLRDGGLVKTVRFKDGTYIGDPINAIRIFNDLRVDELMVLDIDASKEGREPDEDLLRELADEAFMPLGYGGGITTTDQARRILRIGYEKVAFNAASHRNPDIITDASKMFGSQSVVGAMDVKHGLLGSTHRFDHTTGSKIPRPSVTEWTQELERLGAGEILVNFVDRDGMMEGMDVDAIRDITEAVAIPVVACGGAGSLDDVAAAARSGASGVAAGSLFVFRSKKRGVLINYPSPEEVAGAMAPGIDS